MSTALAGIGRTTFRQLLHARRVMIPMLQRDYAQGRSGPAVTEVRQNFVDAINAALWDQKDSLDLGLVYGALEQDDEGESCVSLLDGQQRVTTLFLVHWYLAHVREGWEGAGEARQVLGRFSYETRTTARDFCMALANEPLTIESKSDISEQIKGAAWFFRAWTQDPTIDSMLTMLDAIDKTFKAKKDPACPEQDAVDRLMMLRDRLWARDTPAVTFEFLSMPEYGLTDDLYIKLNARGRPLTDFEKLKAWLERHAAGWTDLGERWEEEMDQEWTDFFWERSGSNPKKMDTTFLRFFRGMALCEFMIDATSADERKRVFDAVADDGFLSTESLESLFTRRGLPGIFAALRKFCDGALKRTGRDDLFETIIGHGPNYKPRVEFHALCRYLLAHGEPFNAAAFDDWMRFVHRLTSNSPIEGPENFARAIRTIHRITPDASGDIYGWLAREKPKQLEGFAGDQIAEEVRKAGLVGTDERWKGLLAAAENHSYFEGQINFLLDVAAGDAAGPDPESFPSYAAMAEKIFSDPAGLVHHKECLVQRALLVQGNYFAWVEGTLWDIGAAGEQWRERLQWRQRLLPQNAKLLRMLLDQLQAGDEETCLRSIIDRSIASDEEYKPDDEWRKYFIRCPQAMDFCYQGHVRFWDSTNREQYVCVVEKNRSPYAEVRSYCFYVEHLKPGAAAFAPFTLKFPSQDQENGGIPFPSLHGSGYTIIIRYLVFGVLPDGPYRIEVRSTPARPLPAEIAELEGPITGQDTAAMNEKGLAHFYYYTDVAAATGLERLLERIRGQAG